MFTSSSTRRRLAGLPALVAAGSLAAVLAACGAGSDVTQPASAETTPATAAEQPDQTTLPPERGRRQPGHSQPPAFNSASGSGQQPGAQFTMPRTRSSQ